MDDEEEIQEGQIENQTVRRTNSELRETYFRWLALVDRVSEVERISFPETFKLSIYEFFNLLSYSRWKDNKTKEQIDRWKRTH